MEVATAAAIPLSDPRLARCGFAKLQGDGIEYFMRKYEITMGRSSKNSTLDLILGDTTTISRQHATIRYNFEAKCFELVVLGKNGVQVESRGETQVYTPDSAPAPLRSRDLLVMGEKKFYFLLPRAMGASRKRRRIEASPMPPPVAALPSAAACAVTAPSSSAAAPAQPPHAAPVPAQSSVHQQPHVANAAHPHAAAPAAPQPQGPAGGIGAAAHGHSAPALLPSAHQQPAAPRAPSESHLSQQSQQTQLQAQQQALFPGGGVAVAGGGGACAATGTEPAAAGRQQDEEDALINTSDPLVYDNGVPYEYDGDPNGFAGGF